MFTSVSFVILTYYPDLLKICALLNSLAPHQVILVDNTPDKVSTFEHLLLQSHKKLLSHVHVITNRRNLGYTGGVNIGLKYASSSNEWIVVLNDDLVFDKKICNSLIKQLETTPVGIAGPFERYFDSRRWTTRITSIQSSLNNKVDRYISGSFFAIHRDVIKKIGIFHESYFIFYEEVEYCMRARKHGLFLTHLSLPDIDHKESSSFEGKTFLHQYYLARNHLLFVERNAPMRVKVYEFVRFPKTIWEHVVRQEWGALAGIRDYLLRRFGPHKNSL